MNKMQLMGKLEQAWEAFKQSWAGLADDQMQEPGVVGDWSVKDILAHVTVWEEEALKYLPLIRQCGTPPRYADMYGGIDTFNAQMTERNRGLPLGEVLSHLEETHQQLVSYLETTPKEMIRTETRFRKRLRLDTYSHYPEHTRAILEWRARMQS
jgi:uncharacterized protein (TIGR03083 family)